MFSLSRTPKWLRRHELLDAIANQMIQRNQDRELGGKFLLDIMRHSSTTARTRIVSCPLATSISTPYTGIW